MPSCCLCAQYGEEQGKKGGRTLGPATGYLCFECEGEGLEGDILAVGDNEFSIDDWALGPSPGEHEPLQLWVVVLSCGISKGQGLLLC